MSDEARFGILLSLEDEDFLDGMRLTAAIMKNTVKQMKEDSKIKLDFTDEEVASYIITLRQMIAAINDEIKNTEDEATKGQLNKQASELNETLEFIVNNLDRFTAEAKKGSIELQKGLQGSIKQASRLALRLIGIRGAWSILSRASHAYMEDNKIINEQLKLSFNILGQALGPVIKELVNIVEYGVILLAKVIQYFTGVNILAKANAAALKNLSKQAQKAQNALAGFDTITNLTDNSDAMSDYMAALGAYTDLQDKMASFEDWWKDWDTLVIGGLIALGSAKVIGSIAKLIGVGGTATAAGTGLLGVSSALGIIAAASVITITCVINGYRQVKELRKEIEKIASDASYINNAGYRKKITDINQLLISQKTNILYANKNLKSQNVLLAGILGIDDDIVKVIENEMKINEENLAVFDEYIDLKDADLDTVKDIYSTVKSQLAINNELKDIYEAQGKSTDRINESTEKYQQILDKINEKYDFIGDAISDIKSKIIDVNSIEFKNKLFSILVDADVKNASDKLTALFNKFGLPFGKNITSSLNTLGINTNKLFEKLYEKVFSFDVGTNYVPQDQLAMVHKGEMIVPKQYNPATSGIGGANEETNALLRQLNNTLENKQFNGYISSKEIGETATNYINQQNRIMGRSVV